MSQGRWLILLCLLFISGCGPSYVKPQVHLPKKWPYNYSFSQNKSINLPTMYWWEQFNNTELNQVIKKALANNGKTKIAAANIEYAHGQLEQIKLSWLPNVGLLAGFTQFPILGDPGGLAIAYPSYIVNLFQLYKQQKSAKALYEASIYMRQTAVLVIIADSAASFFTLIAQQEALELYNRLLANYQKYLTLVRTQYRSGLTSFDQIDEIQTRIILIQSRIEIVKHNILVSKNAIRYLFNEHPGPLEITTPFKSINSEAFIPGNVPASVLRARPDVHRAESQLKAANADIGAVTANLLPTLTLGSYLGGTANNSGVTLLESYITAPVIDLPIFAQIKTSKARYKELYIQYIIVIQEALRDVANDLSAFSAYTSQLKHTIAALKSETKHCRLTASRNRHGLEDGLSLVKCSIRVNELALLINRRKLEKMLVLVRLYQDLAGGYRGY